MSVTSRVIIGVTPRKVFIILHNISYLLSPLGLQVSKARLLASAVSPGAKSSRCDLCLQV